jgi:hypothetical protein
MILDFLNNGAIGLIFITPLFFFASVISYRSGLPESSPNERWLLLVWELDGGQSGGKGGSVFGPAHLDM